LFLPEGKSAIAPCGNPYVSKQGVLMRKLLLSFVIALVTVTTQANTVSQQGLKAAFDDFTFAVVTEWDQKDQTFYNNRLEELQEKLSALRAEGLSNKEILDFAVTQITDRRLAQDVKHTLALLDLEAITDFEALDQIKVIMSNSYGQGANWSGRAVAMTGAAVAIVLFIYALQSSDGEVANI
jgi:hypothetical protein